MHRNVYTTRMNLRYHRKKLPFGWMPDTDIIVMHAAFILVPLILIVGAYGVLRTPTLEEVSVATVILDTPVDNGNYCDRTDFKIVKSGSDYAIMRTGRINTTNTFSSASEARNIINLLYEECKKPEPREWTVVE